MHVILTAIISMGTKLLTSSVIEPLVLLLVGELVKRSSSKVDDEAFEIIKKAIEGK